MLKSSDIANYLNKKLYGNDININNVSSINNIKENSIMFLKNSVSNEIIKKINLYKYNILKIVSKNIEVSGPYIISENPRSDFFKVISKFFNKENNEPQIEIGLNTFISENVIIKGNVKIGNNCYIKPFTVIGDAGFSYEFENDVPFKIPHLGGVKIGDNVDIGSFVTIDRGTLDNTIIKNDVKINNFCHIGHNVVVEENTLIGLKSTISGSCHIGKNVWIAMNCTLRNGINIGDNTFIGTCSNVTKSFGKNLIIYGNPSKIIKDEIYRR